MLQLCLEDVKVIRHLEQEQIIPFISTGKYAFANVCYFIPAMKELADQEPIAKVIVDCLCKAPMPDPFRFEDKEYVIYTYPFEGQWHYFVILNVPDVLINVGLSGWSMKHVSMIESSIMQYIAKYKNELMSIPERPISHCDYDFVY